MNERLYEAAPFPFADLALRQQILPSILGTATAPIAYRAAVTSFRASGGAVR